MKKYLIGIFILLIIWTIAALLIPKFIILPNVVIMATIENFYQLIPHILASMYRLLIGISISILFGMHIGYLMGLSKIADKLMLPLIYAFYPIPKIALLPIIMLLFGINDGARITLIIIITIFPIILYCKNAIEHIPNSLFLVAKSMNLSRWQYYKSFIIPATLPSLLAAIKITIGTAIAILYISESFATQKGLGYYISSNNGISTTNMYIGILVLGVIGYLLFIFIDIIEIKFCKWHKNSL